MANLCRKSGLDWVKMANFACFSIFSPKMEAGIDLEWSVSPDSQLFPSCATKASQFWRNLKNFHFLLGGTSANFLSFPTFSNCFTPMRLKMTHNGKFGQKSVLDWVKMANFACFSISSPKMSLRLTRNGQFHLIHNFSHLLPQSISFLGLWYLLYNTFDNRKVIASSVKLPMVLAKKYPSYIHLDYTYLARSHSTEGIYFTQDGWLWDWSKHYCVHLYARYVKMYIHLCCL